MYQTMDQVGNVVVLGLQATCHCFPCYMLLQPLSTLRVVHLNWVWKKPLIFMRKLTDVPQRHAKPNQPETLRIYNKIKTRSAVEESSSSQTCPQVPPVFRDEKLTTVLLYILFMVSYLCKAPLSHSLLHQENFVFSQWMLKTDVWSGVDRAAGWNRLGGHFNTEIHETATEMIIKS